MFTAAQFRKIRRNCPNEMEKLLGMLGIPSPDWQQEEEYAVYERLDNVIVEKVCKLLKSRSVIEGYISLLKMAGISYSFSETETELLAKIVSHREDILREASK